MHSVKYISIVATLATLLSAFVIAHLHNHPPLLMLYRLRGSSTGISSSGGGGRGGTSISTSGGSRGGWNGSGSKGGSGGSYPWPFGYPFHPGTSDQKHNTNDDGDGSRKKHGIVIGGIFAGALVIALLACVVSGLRNKWRKRKQRKQPVLPTTTQQTRIDLPEPPEKAYIPQPDQQCNATFAPAIQTTQPAQPPAYTATYEEPCSFIPNLAGKHH